MAITLLNHLTAAGTSTFTSPSGDTTGASLLVLALTEASAGLATISDSKGNTWTLLTEQTGTPSCRLYYVANPVVGTSHTFTATGAAMLAVISVAWFGGVQKASPFDVQSGAVNAAFVNTAQPGSVLPGISNELVVSAFAWISALTVTSVTGMVITDQTNFSAAANYGGGLAYVVQTGAPASANPTWNFSATLGGSVVAATFRAAWGGSPSDTPFRSS
jgi:hypothetical protein